MWMLGWMILVSMSCWSGGVGGSRRHGHMKRTRGPSSLEFYYHDIRYGGNNMKNNTSAMMDKRNAWFTFTAILNTPHYNGAFTFIGADWITLKKRDISVIGGTDDFALARGIMTLQFDAVEENLTYFCLLFSVKLSTDFVQLEAILIPL
eukprot:Gb_23180 [translate_table: standard]